MKIKNIKNIMKYGVFTFLVISIISCAYLPWKKLPVVHHATYQPYNFNNEKGYVVEFELSNEMDPPEALVINKIKQKITINDRNGVKYKVNVIAQTTKIANYIVEGSDRGNGIFFKSNKGDGFKKVDFTLIK